MAWPMIEWVLDTCYPALQSSPRARERSVIVFGTMEATLTPLMEEIESEFAGVKVFSLPTLEHPEWGRHIELGVKGEPALMAWPSSACLQGSISSTPSSAQNWCADRLGCASTVRFHAPKMSFHTEFTGMFSAKF
jgi:hypothetical protein